MTSGRLVTREDFIKFLEADHYIKKARISIVPRQMPIRLDTHTEIRVEVPPRYVKYITPFLEISAPLNYTISVVPMPFFRRLFARGIKWV